MGRLLLCFAFASILGVAFGNLSVIVGMMTQMLQDCREEKGCNISDAMFRRFMVLDPTLLDEGVSGEESEAAWSWVSCLYEQGGVVETNGDIGEDGLTMFIDMAWEQDENENKKAAEIVKACAKEGTDNGKTRAEKMFLFYKCMVEKEIPAPDMMKKMKGQMDAGKECVQKYPIGIDDFCSLTQFKPMTKAQGDYSACMAIATKSEGDQICSCYIPKGIEKIKDEKRRKEYQDAYDKCKNDMEGYQENYDKVNDFEKFSDHIVYIFGCLVNNVANVTIDDFYSLQ